MKIRQLAIELCELEDKRAALDSIPRHIQTLELSYVSIRAASTDGTAASGGDGNRREEALINNIAARDKLKRDYRGLSKKRVYATFLSI